MATCPACNAPCDIDRQTFLLDAEARWYQRESEWMGSAKNSPASINLTAPREEWMRYLAMRGLRNWFWACDRCIDEGRAIAGNVEVQNLSMGTPFAAYVDRPFQCKDCGRPSTFTAREQCYWYESRRFLIWSHATRCAECRAARRANRKVCRALEKSLASIDANTPAGLDRIAELYRQLGNVKKSNEYAARAKNLREAEQGR